MISPQHRRLSYAHFLPFAEFSQLSRERAIHREDTKRDTPSKEMLGTLAGGITLGYFGSRAAVSVRAGRAAPKMIAEEVQLFHARGDPIDSMPFMLQANLVQAVNPQATPVPDLNP